MRSRAALQGELPRPSGCDVSAEAGGQSRPRQPLLSGIVGTGARAGGVLPDLDRRGRTRVPAGRESVNDAAPRSLRARTGRAVCDAHAARLEPAGIRQLRGLRKMTTPIIEPAMSVVIPTFNNELVLRRAIASWGAPAVRNGVDLIVVEDGCKDGTRAFLDHETETAWGARHLRVLHLDDAHELRCTNAGMRAARAPLVMAWQDDLFVRGGGLPAPA